MPSRPSTFHCFCASCIVKGGNNSDGSPCGQILPTSQRTAHLKRVQAEELARREAEESTTRERDSALIEQASLSIFSSTLTDPGPDINSQPSRLWNSRAGYQIQKESSLQSVANSLPVDAVVEGIRRLQVVPAVLDNNNDPYDSILPVDPSAANPDIILEAPRRLDGITKRERSRLTQKAHIILDNVEKRIASVVGQFSSSEQSFPDLSSLEEEIREIQMSFDNVKRSIDSVNKRKAELKPKVEDIQARLSTLCEERPIVNEEGPVRYSSDHLFDIPVDKHDSVAQVTMFIVVVCNVMLGVSRRMGDLILGLLTIMLRMSFRWQTGDLSEEQQFVINQIPGTVETLLKKFKLEGKTTTYAVCPNCNCTYPPKFLPGSNVPLYPQKCTNRPMPDVICDALLLGTAVDGRSQPVQKAYIHNSFHDYLGSLLARKDLEDLMDRACDDAILLINDQSSPPAFVTDVFQGEFVRDFQGPDSGKLFIDRPGTEGRYLFAFNFDFFSAEGQTIRGASASCGLISAACLNLPLDIRHKPENMYVAGIIPGPKEPSKTELNHFIRPIVDSFCDSWKRGIHYSRTARYPKGRTTRSAIAIAINDLPAARQLSQSAGHSSHHYCTRCSCYHKDTLGRTDITHSDWNPKDVNTLRQKAEAWRTANSEKDREKLFFENGLRWSELWRLPYWDPTKMLVVDSMHCLLEGLAQYHFCELLGLTETTAKAKEEVIHPFQYEFPTPTEDYVASNLKSKNDLKHIAKIHDLLLAPIGKEGDDNEVHFHALSTRLRSKTNSALRFVVNSIGAKPPNASHNTPPGNELHYKKDECVQALLAWRRKYPLRVPADNSNIKHGTIDVLKHIHAVIHDMDTPSWLRSVPSNFGYSAAGTLKADEWRTMSTVYLPVALVSLWGEGSVHPSPAVASSARQILDHTMMLVCAISLACMRTTSKNRTDAYLHYIIGWLSNLQGLHSKAKATTNCHMAIHLFEFLCMFGPVRSWWCFPFERLIGQLQRLPSNHKFGELEATMLSSFSKAARLKQWLSRSDCPDFLKECKIVFDKAFGTLPDGAEPIKDETFGAVPDDLLLLISDSKVALHARHKFDDIIFSRRSTHIGNSLIMFYPRGDKKLSPVPASIHYIFSRKNHKVVYAVHRQLDSPPGTVDPFLYYTHFPAKIYSTKLASKLEIVEPGWVYCHYGRWNLDADRAVVLTLTQD